jgi:beta-lactamase superfamily II metal-dependent hydrolase
VGENYYGHPNIDIINLLDRWQVEILRTDLLGNITIK